MTGMRRDLSRRGRTAVLQGLAFPALVLGLTLAGCAGPKAQISDATGATVAKPAPAERSIVSGLEISAVGPETRIRLNASPEPKYSFSVTENPAVAALDLYNATLQGISPETAVKDGVVDSISAQALPGGAARIQVRLASPAEARAISWEKGLDILVRPKAATSAAPASAGEQRRVTHPLEKGDGILFDFGAQPTNLGSFVLSDGRRLVVDADGVEISAPQITEEVAEGPIERVRIGRQTGRVRAVIEGRRSGVFEGYQLERRKDGFALVLASPATAAVAAAAPAASPASTLGAETPRPPTPPGPPPVGGGTVIDLGFRQDVDSSRVEIDLSEQAPHEVREATGERVVVDLLHTALPKRFRRALDTSAFPGPVRLIAAYPHGQDTRLVVDLKSPAPFRVDRTDSQIALVFQGGSGEPQPARAPEEKPKGPEYVVVDSGAKATAPPAGGPTGPASAGPTPTVPTPSAYTGQRISMDFVDADIRNVLRLIGDVSQLNVVAGDDVSGKVTVRLVDVPWDQALDVILKTRGLGLVREDNVIRIAPAEKLDKERARALEAAKASEEKAPLVADIIPVNYASAKELSDKVKSVLTQRGSVSIDERTNALLVKDVEQSVRDARALVARLDTQTPQVLIEARVVEVSSTYAKDLGVQWGGQFTASAETGNATGWAFPNSIGVTGDTGSSDFAINFPSTGGLAGSPGGALAVTLGHVNDILTLDLRLSAIETAGRGRVISSPRVTTLDNKTAEISQGISIPFTTATEEKIETQSIDYKLKLNVTPHVTSDRSIIMKIELTKDAPSTTFFAVDSRTPAKETRAATTEVLVKDGETTVIGGIITDTQSKNESGIPFFSKLPWIGALFRRKNDTADKTELIIFITPKIANAAMLARSE